MNRLIVALALISVPGGTMAQQLTDAQGRVRVALVKMPYTGARNVPEISDVPDYLEDGGIFGLDLFSHIALFHASLKHF